MDSQDVLMKRLAAASHNKISSILPKSELQLRRILLTTRLWNEVRRQQALVFTSLQDDWLFSQDDADSLPTPGDTSTATALEELDPLTLSMLSSSSPDDNEHGITSEDQQHQDELDDDDEDDEEDDDEDDTKFAWLYDDVDSNAIKESSNMEQQDVKKSYDWTWMDDGTKEADHETMSLVTSPYTTLTPTTASSASSLNENDDNHDDFYDSSEIASSSIINESRKRRHSVTASPERSTTSESAASSASTEAPRKRIKVTCPSASTSTSSSPSTFAMCNSSASSTVPAISAVSTDPPAGPRSPRTPSSPVLLSV